jgi:hypothetical protein
MRIVHSHRAARRAVVAFASVLLVAVINVNVASAEAEHSERRFAERTPVQSAGDAPAGFGTWAEVFAMQEKLNSAAEKIVAAPGEGFAGIVAAPQNRDVRVYWKGDVPASLRALASGLDVPVKFLPAKFTERELLAETKRLGADPQVRSVGPEVDGSGLRINVTSAGRQAIQSGTGLLGTTTVPLHLESGPEPSALLRQNDIAPYWGGAWFTTPSALGCSTGFAINWGGLDHMLSAGHCGNNGEIAVDGGGNPAIDTMGTVFNDVPVRDTMMIDTPSQGNIYIGPWDSNTGMDVIGAEADIVGNLVCTSGARSGEHCGLTVTHVNQTDNGWSPLTRAVHPSGGCAAAGGDSGGPVFRYSSDGWPIGRGTISTGRRGTASCPNAPVSDSSSVVWYAPLLRPAGDPQVGSLQFYGATIRVD